MITKEQKITLIILGIALFLGILTVYLRKNGFKFLSETYSENEKQFFYKFGARKKYK